MIADHADSESHCHGDQHERAMQRDANGELAARQQSVFDPLVHDKIETRCERSV